MKQNVMRSDWPGLRNTNLNVYCHAQTRRCFLLHPTSSPTMFCFDNEKFLEVSHTSWSERKANRNLLEKLHKYISHRDKNVSTYLAKYFSINGRSREKKREIFHFKMERKWKKWHFSPNFWPAIRTFLNFPS